MKKLTSILMSGMLAVTGCVCAVTASAEDVETAKITVVDGKEVTAVYEVPVGEKIECTVKGTSTEKITGFHTSVYVNQADAASLVDESELDVLGYAEAYFSNGVHYDPGMFASMHVRPVNPAEFNLDKLSFVFTAGLPVSGFDAGVDMIKVAYEVKNAGECTIVTTMDDATYDDENGIPTKDKTCIKTVTTLNVDEYTEGPTEPTDPSEPIDDDCYLPTDPSEEITEPTFAPTEPTDPSKPSEPTDVTNPTTAPTNATNATNATSATTSSSTTNTTSSSTTTGKVATGDTATIAMIMAAILLASAGTVVIARKRLAK